MGHALILDFWGACLWKCVSILSTKCVKNERDTNTMASFHSNINTCMQLEEYNLSTQKIIKKWLLLSSFTMWLCSVLLFVPFKVSYNYENQSMHIDINTDRRITEEKEWNCCVYVTTCIRGPIESFSRDLIKKWEKLFL